LPQGPRFTASVLKNRGGETDVLIGPMIARRRSLGYPLKAYSYAARARVASIVSIIDRKIVKPSALPSRSSQARSGCGIKPKTFPSGLQIPAIFSIDPFGLAEGSIRPSDVA